MSFSWWCEDKSGANLVKEFGVNAQALGLGPHSDSDTKAPHCVSYIRVAWEQYEYKNRLQDAARDAVRQVQTLARENLDSLKPQHCGTCSCPEIEPNGWTRQDIEHLLAIPLERVWRAGGGY